MSEPHSTYLKQSPLAARNVSKKDVLQIILVLGWGIVEPDDQVWELCLLNVAVEPLYIHEEGVVDYVGDRVDDRVDDQVGDRVKG